MLSSPRRPATTIRIFSSAEYCLRVRRRMSRTVASAPSFKPFNLWLIFVPFGHCDEPEILRSANPSICSVGADVRHTVGVYEFLKATRRSTSTGSYDLFGDMLTRLCGTTVKVTAYSDGGQLLSYEFNWINKFPFYNSNGNALSVEVLVSDRFSTAIADRNAVVTIDEAYFSLDKGLERRLYELAIKHLSGAHYAGEWNVGLERLAAICGATEALRRFNMRLRQIATMNSLPGIRLEVMPDLARRLPSPSQKRGYHRLGTTRVRFTLDQPR